MNDWKPGARAVIMVSEWPANRGRVVKLHQRIDGKCFADGMTSWWVKDGHLFEGYAQMGTDLNCAPNIVVKHERLMIAQWQLRLLDDKEPVWEDTSTGIEYAVT